MKIEEPDCQDVRQRNIGTPEEYWAKDGKWRAPLSVVKRLMSRLFPQYTTRTSRDESMQDGASQALSRAICDQML